jgi:Glutathione S-transferase, N-terminal domain
VYHAPPFPNSRRVRMFLAEKGISLPLVSIDLAGGGQHGNAYRANNPHRVVSHRPHVGSPGRMLGSALTKRGADDVVL